MIVTQHVKNIDTLSDAQNAQLQHAMNNEDRDVTARDSIPAAASAPTAASNNGGTTNTAGRKKSKKSKKQWTRSAHGTRGASKRAQVAATQEESSASDVVVNAAFERFPTNYSDVMRSNKRDDWTKALKTRLRHSKITTSENAVSARLGQKHCTPSGSTRPRLMCKKSLSGLRRASSLAGTNRC